MILHKCRELFIRSSLLVVVSVQIFRKLSIQSVATVYEALSSLLQLSPITPESLSAPIRVAMDALVPMVTFLNETNSISSPINLMQVRHLSIKCQ